jgi:outer membrane biosynthesis protein TonB
LTLKAGSFAQVSLIIGEKGDTIVVDESAVDREGNFEFVWVVEKGRAHRQRVITGVREKNKTEIVAGLRQGQIVVTAGQIRLADGMNVNITNMTPEAAAEGEKKPEEKKDEAKPENKDEKKPEAVKEEDAQVKTDDKKQEEKKEEKKPEEAAQQKPLAHPQQPSAPVESIPQGNPS